MLRGTFGPGDRILAEVDPDHPEKLRFSKIPRIEPPAPQQPEVQSA